MYIINDLCLKGGQHTNFGLIQAMSNKNTSGWSRSGGVYAFKKLLHQSKNHTKYTRIYELSCMPAWLCASASVLKNSQSNAIFI